MFVARYTHSGIDSVMEWDEYKFDQCLESSLRLYKLDLEQPVKAIVLGFAKEE